MSVPRPHWFRHDKVLISTAPTCGISKSGGLLAKFDPATGRKVEHPDEFGVVADVVNDQLLADMEALRDGGATETLQFVDRPDVDLRTAVPSFYDRRYHDAFVEAMQTPAFAGFTTATLGGLINDGLLAVRNGHGSAPKDLRVGEVPYIKVSDLRAGQININPTNRVPLRWAEQMWGGPSSGLLAYDLLSPERASRNIGDFCVLMPGQEQILVTKEVIILRPGPKAYFDPFYLLWAMTLKVVRAQWSRVVFMQTNREDVGKRYLEVEIPLAPDAQRANEVSEPFRRYFTTLAAERNQLREYLRTDNAHHFFLAGAEPSDDELNAPAEGG